MSTLRRVTEDARDARVSGASSLVAGMAIHGQADSAGGTEPLRRSFITSRRWYRAVLPLMMVIYAGEVIPGSEDVRGGRFIVVVAVLIVFCLLYLVAMFRVGGDRRSVMWTILGVMIACNVAELILVGGSAMIMWMLLVAPLIIRYKLRSAPVIVGVVVLSYVLPFLEPRWRMAGDLSIPAQILSVSLLVLLFVQLVCVIQALEQAQAALERMSRASERLQIARDLHDVLGHTLISIAIKAELAGKLIDRDSDRAQVEIGQVEALARQSLADVRATVAGYRARSLATELVAVSELLGSAGVQVVIEEVGEPASPGARELFAWVIRESVTNVVRHAKATTCKIVIEGSSVCVRDDGLGVSTPYGDGLKGLQERVWRTGGSFEAGPIEPHGWQVKLTLAETGLQ
jgi:two-component system sensor histidine kinase DesK